MDRSTVFIDGGYLGYVLKAQFREPRIDFKKLFDVVCSGTERLRTYYYHCMPWQSDPPTEVERNRYAAMDRFLYKLRQIPRVEVRLGKLAKRGEEFVQKRVDILLAVDLVRMSWDHQIQRAVLFAGDSDFVPAVQASKDAGILVQLYYGAASIHDELLTACDDRFAITQELIDAVTIHQEPVR